MKTLVIPDIHNKVDLAEKIIAREKAGHVVFLGDFFDDWNDTVKDAQKTAKWVKKLLDVGSADVLLGNHDQAYGWGWANRQHICSGWTPEKALAVSEILSWNDWKKFKLHTWVDGILLTHAGWNKYFNQDKGISDSNLPAFIDREMERVLKSLHDSNKMGDWKPYELDPLLAPSMSRGGRNLHGGITWEDFQDLEPPVGFHQLVGHTQGKTVRTKPNATCIDTRLNHYAIIEDGRLLVKET